MRRNIFPHRQFIDETNVVELNQMGFVFLCIEGANKRVIVNYLIENKIPFIDVGMGLSSQDNTFGGLARATTCTPEHKTTCKCTNWLCNGEHNEYSQNIQIADVNAPNACLAAIKWKKSRGFYVDLEHEYNTVIELTLTHLQMMRQTMEQTIKPRFLKLIPRLGIETGTYLLTWRNWMSILSPDGQQLTASPTKLTEPSWAQVILNRKETQLLR